MTTRVSFFNFPASARLLFWCNISLSEIHGCFVKHKFIFLVLCRTAARNTSQNTKLIPNTQLTKVLPDCSVFALNKQNS